MYLRVLQTLRLLMFNLFKKNKTIFTPVEGFDYYHYFSKAERIEVEKLFKRVFLSTEGKKALAYLQFITCQKSQNHNTTKEQLVFYEGQKSLVTNIIRLISNN